MRRVWVKSVFNFSFVLKLNEKRPQNPIAKIFFPITLLFLAGARQTESSVYFEGRFKILTHENAKFSYKVRHNSNHPVYLHATVYRGYDDIIINSKHVSSTSWPIKKKKGNKISLLTPFGQEIKKTLPTKKSWHLRSTPSNAYVQWPYWFLSAAHRSIYTVKRLLHGFAYTRSTVKYVVH